MIARDLRYPSDRPRRVAQEKGNDVALAPALEAALALRPGDPPACEVAAWTAPGGRPRSLSVRGASIRRHLLSQTEYRAVADPTDYTLSR